MPFRSCKHQFRPPTPAIDRYCIVGYYSRATHKRNSDDHDDLNLFFMAVTKIIYNLFSFTLHLTRSCTPGAKRHFVSFSRHSVTFHNTLSAWVKERRTKRVRQETTFPLPSILAGCWSLGTGSWLLGSFHQPIDLADDWRRRSSKSIKSPDFITTSRVHHI